MKKIILFLLTTFSALFFPVSVFAEEEAQPNGLPASIWDNVDPLRRADNTAAAGNFSTPGAIVTAFLSYAIPIASLILFVMIIWGGFEMVMSATGGKKDAGRQRVTTAITGFILLFCAYWIAQIVQRIFGVQFLN